jgi:ribosomal protein L7/L12
MPTFDEILQECRKKIDQGKGEEQIIHLLHETNQSMIDSIKAVRLLYGISTAEAKEKVAGHPEWQKTAGEMDKVHEEIIQQLKSRHKNKK